MNMLISQTVPYVGIVCMLVGIVFAIVAASDSPSKNSPGDVLAAAKYDVLAYSLILAGGFMLLGPVNKQ